VITPRFCQSFVCDLPPVAVLKITTPVDKGCVESRSGHVCVSRTCFVPPVSNKPVIIITPTGGHRQSSDKTRGRSPRNLGGLPTPSPGMPLVGDPTLTPSVLVKNPLGSRLYLSVTLTRTPPPPAPAGGVGSRPGGGGD
jgi:hypothetical protein